MKTKIKTLHQIASLLALSLALTSTDAQVPIALPAFGGAFTAPAGATTYLLPPDGQLNYTTINIPAAATVRFARNAANTPVYMIATGAVEIQGLIDVSGTAGTANAAGLSGPGGFDGGTPGVGLSAPGDGLGPGAGSGARPANGATPAIGAGSAAYGTVPNQPPLSQNGQVYGSQLLMPLVGGSGGGGSTVGGGGGGGAILIKSDTQINISGNGTVRAWGGTGGGQGSGGAIRLIAPIIRGDGIVDVTAGLNQNWGNGRIRCDLTDRSNFAQLLHYPASAPFTSDQYLPLAFPPNPVPSLRIVSVGSFNVPPNSPAGFPVVFPVNASLSQPVVLEASGFGTQVPIVIKRTPVSGPALPITNATIPNTGANPATVSIPLDFPANVPITLNVWTL
jgi:hypothetical protein